MPLEQALIDLMLDEVILELVTGGPDSHNEFTFGSPITAKCQIVKMNRMVRDRSGRELVSTVGVIFADPTIALTADARLTLPDGDKPAIIEVLAAKDEVGPYYLELRA